MRWNCPNCSTVIGQALENTCHQIVDETRPVWSFFDRHRRPQTKSHAHDVNFLRYNMEWQGTMENAREGPDPEPRPFSIVLAPTATLAVQHHTHGGGVFIRHLHIQREQHQQQGIRDKINPSGPLSDYPNRVSSVVIVVRAQPHALHIFRGRRLCRVVEFPSPVSDVSGLPSSMAESLNSQPPSILCVAVCRDGTAYALPSAEVMELAQGGTRQHSLGWSGPTRAAEISGDHVKSTADALKKHDRSSASTSSAAPVGIFEDLAPTIVSDELSSARRRRTASGGGSGDKKRGGSSSNGSGTNGDGDHASGMGGLVIRAKERWAVFEHIGARSIVAFKGERGCPSVAATAGIIDQAAVYELASNPTSSAGETATPPVRIRRTLAGVDGDAPTSLCAVWMNEDGADGTGLSSSGGGDGDAAWGDGKGFPLPSTLFRALFGAEVARKRKKKVLPTLEPKPASSDNSADGSQGRSLVDPIPAVLLLGDAAGVVRWSSLREHGGKSSGIFAKLSAAIVATLPQLDAHSRAVGVLIVSADGEVLSLTTGNSRRTNSRKRARSEVGVHDYRHVGAGVDGREKEKSRTETLEDERRESDMRSPATIVRQLFRLPSPIASACSTPGFLMHSYAGALFASAIPTEVDTQSHVKQKHNWRGPGKDSAPHRSGTNGLGADHNVQSTHETAPTLGAVMLRPVRLPLPCDTVSMAVAPLLVDDEGSTSPATPSSTSFLHSLVVCLTARGRLVGFMAPHSAEELDGWALDAGKGGVRVGGSAGVERRVRCQLERLSSVGRQCAELSAESAERDREIRAVRGATRFLPSLDATKDTREGRRQASGSGHGNGGPWSAVKYAVSMGPDVDEGMPIDASFSNGMEHDDALRVRMRIRLWFGDGTRAGEMPRAGEDGAGRWFVVTRAVAYEDGGRDEREVWGWSTAAMVDLGSLRRGRSWSSVVALTLPSARPVMVTSWLQFRFDEDSVSVKKAGGSGDRAGYSPDTSTRPHDASGVCVELGRARFDILDWADRLSSVPGSAAAIHRLARGRGGCFCGPELEVTDVMDGGLFSSALSDGSSDRLGKRQGTGRATTVVGPPVQVDLGSFRLRLVCGSHTHLVALLKSLVSASMIQPPSIATAERGTFAPIELAFRLAGQVGVVRASDCTAAVAREEATREGWPSRKGDAVAELRVVEIAVTCSHEAMAPLVREALLHRRRVLGQREEGWGYRDDAEDERETESYGDEDTVRGVTVARLLREIHPIREAVVDASDTARALNVARARDGPSVETSRGALALMSKVGELYRMLRRQQESAGCVL